MKYFVEVYRGLRVEWYVPLDCFMRFLMPLLGPKRNPLTVRLNVLFTVSIQAFTELETVNASLFPWTPEQRLKNCFDISAISPCNRNPALR